LIFELLCLNVNGGGNLEGGDEIQNEVLGCIKYNCQAIIQQ